MALSKPRTKLAAIAAARKRKPVASSMSRGPRTAASSRSQAPKRRKVMGRRSQ